MTTLATAITNVRYLLDEPVAQFWSNLELTSYINEGCKDIARRLETKQSTHTITLPAATVPKQNFTLPSTAYRIHRVEFYPTNDNTTIMYVLEYRGLMEMDQIWGINKKWPASYPMFYTIWKSPPKLQMITYPVSQTPGKFIIYYYEMITPAVATTDDIDVLPGYEDLVYDYSAYRAYRKDGNSIAKTYQASYEQKLSSMQQRTRSFQDQGNFFSTGQTALPSWLTSFGTT